MVFATAAAIQLNQQNQNLQNKAAVESKCLSSGQSDCFTTPCCDGLQCSKGICVGKDIGGQQVPCDTFVDYYNRYCPNGGTDSTLKDAVPCSQIKLTISNYCRTTSPTSVRQITPTSAPKLSPTQTPAPTLSKANLPVSTVKPTLIPRTQATAIPTRVVPTTASSRCQEGSTRTIGRFYIICQNGRWYIRLSQSATN